jgi:hypothetical protein
LAAFVGTLSWAGIAFDRDYNFALLPPDGHGLTLGNDSLSSGQRYIEAEFDSDETADRFQTDWWRHFREVADRQDDSVVQKLITPLSGNLPLAVVQGMFGLDCEHDCHSELHPVYGLAIELEDTSEDNTWAIFVRNWGNEGFCSRFDHQLRLPSGKITLFLPRATAGTPTVLGNTQFHTSDDKVTKFPTVQHVAGQGTAITFTLPPPAEHSLSELILHLKWTGDTYTGPPPGARVPAQLFAQQFTTKELEHENKPVDAEEYLNGLYRAKVPIPPERPQRPTTAPELLNQPLANLSSATVVEETQPPANPGRTHKNEVRSVVVADRAKLQRDCEAIQRVCKAYNDQPPADKVPRFPELCARLKAPDACAAQSTTFDPPRK